MTCESCGQPTNPAARFCATCGVSLARQAMAHPVAPLQQPAPFDPRPARRSDDQHSVAWDRREIVSRSYSDDVSPAPTYALQPPAPTPQLAPIEVRLPHPDDQPYPYPRQAAAAYPQFVTVPAGGGMPGGMQIVNNVNVSANAVAPAPTPIIAPAVVLVGRQRSPVLAIAGLLLLMVWVVAGLVITASSRGNPAPFVFALATAVPVALVLIAWLVHEAS